LKGFQAEGITPYAISIQNEPENSDASYPSMTLDAATEAQIGQALRALMNDNGFGDTLLIGYEHNWVDASGYPVQLVSPLPGSRLIPSHASTHRGDFKFETW
jgi:O-glycosyl hydrolase